jgi:hypothetical protein
MSNIVRVGAYGYQKRQVIPLEDAETRAQMGLDAEVWALAPSEAEEGADIELPVIDGDERVLNAARAM